MEYRVVDENDHLPIIEHLRSTFFVDEPLNVAVQLCPNGEGHEELEKQCIESMKDGYSIVAMEGGEVMGVALNGILHHGDTKKALQKLETMNDEKFKKIFTLIYSTAENVVNFSKFGVDEMLESRIISVSPKARGKGVAGELLKQTIELAKACGLKAVKGDATGLFSQKIFEKLGFQTFGEVIYNDYIDPETGLPVFDVPAPHKSLKIMAMKL